MFSCLIVVSLMSISFLTDPSMAYVVNTMRAIPTSARTGLAPFRRPKVTLATPSKSRTMALLATHTSSEDFAAVPAGAIGPDVITREHLQGLKVSAQAGAAADEAAEYKQLRKDVKCEVDKFVQVCLKDAGSCGGSTSTDHVMWFHRKTDLTCRYVLQDMVERELAPRMSGVTLSVTSSKHNPECISVHAFWG